MRAKRWAVKRWSALAGLALGLVLLVGCREIRVKTLAAGTTTVLGGNQIVIVRDAVALGKFGIHAPLHYKSEFGVVLVDGPARPHGLQADRRVDSAPACSASGSSHSSRNPPTAANLHPSIAPTRSGSFRTSVYRRGVRVEVVTPSNEPIASTYLP